MQVLMASKKAPSQLLHIFEIDVIDNGPLLKLLYKHAYNSMVMHIIV